MNILIVYNQSKNVADLTHFLNLLKQQSFTFDLLETTNLYAGISKIKCIEPFNYDCVVAAGGDGTVLSVINGLQQINRLNVPILILPIGTANDFAHELNIDRPLDALRALEHAQKKLVDLIACQFTDSNGNENKLYANSSAGVGFLSAIFSQQEKKIVQITKQWFGGFSYALLSFVMLGRAKGYHARIQINNLNLHSHIQMLLIRKTKITGPVSLIPFASPQSGWLDSVLFYHANMFNRFRIALSMILVKSIRGSTTVKYFGTDEQSESALTQPTKITVKSEQSIPVDLNGEFVGYSPCEFEIKPAAAVFFCNPAH